MILDSSWKIHKQSLVLKAGEWLADMRYWIGYNESPVTALHVTFELVVFGAARALMDVQVDQVNLVLDLSTLTRITPGENEFQQRPECSLSQSSIGEVGALGAYSTHVDSGRVDGPAVDDVGAASVANKSGWGMGITALGTTDLNKSSCRAQPQSKPRIVALRRRQKRFRRLYMQGVVICLGRILTNLLRDAVARGTSTEESAPATSKVVYGVGVTARKGAPTWPLLRVLRQRERPCEDDLMHSSTALCSRYDYDVSRFIGV